VNTKYPTPPLAATAFQFQRAKQAGNQIPDVVMVQMNLNWIIQCPCMRDSFSQIRNIHQGDLRTMDKEQPTSLIAACQHFFGRKPNQSIGEFSEEFKKLTEKDRNELKEMLERIGYKIK
jgi:hypothetical protein